ncbi:DNA polymeras-like protein zeta catalytic subunit [Bimuria novae-zelandiae CBS 107.79]|uniref:DNA polymerase n=1 Tax=Bimuria novae-zelandiae CBS 107.79 TaxID=1447943 RepID=A0A6A5UQL1_9PLEO|nr:DNA polymeras-like protein zeta catalytic subunit [Bimuria novae-zelandiae CBS 107.79]
MDTFRFRLNCIDHYQVVPTELDPVLRRAPSHPQRQQAPPVPVIRVFGATETGQKVCAHIHGALPYLYLDYHGSLEKDVVNAYMRSLRASIDHALAATYRRNAYDWKSIYVGHITLVKGIPFYGYQVGYSFFLKVYLLNPAHMTRFADLLHQGAIMNRIFQPYESHLQYILQWMCDYNLYGCAYINCAKVQFRGPVPDSNSIDTTTHKWHDASIAEQYIADQDQYPRQSHCSIEVDICTQDILNRHELHSRPIHTDPFEQETTLKIDEKYVPSMAGLWRDETLRRKRRMGLSDPSSSPFPLEVLVSMSADTRSSSKGGWIHEEEYRERLKQLVQDECQHARVVDHATLTKPAEGEAYIQTALESVEDFYPGRMESHLLLEEEDQPIPLAEHDVVPHHDHADIPLLGDNMDSAEISDEMDTGDPSDLDEPPSMDPLSISEAQMHQQRDKDIGLTDSGVQREEFPDKENDAQNSDQVSDSRKRSPPVENHEPGKKRRLSHDRTSNVDAINRTEESAENMIESKDTSSADRRSLQGSTKTQDIGGQSTLSYPIPKKPNIPTTTLRLVKHGHSSLGHSSHPVSTNSKGSGLGQTYVTPRSSRTHQHAMSPHHNANTFGKQATANFLVNQLAQATTRHSHTLHFGLLPPSAHAVKRSLSHEGLLPVLYQDAYYSEETDVPERPREYAGHEYVLQSTTIPYLPAFDPSSVSQIQCEDDAVAAVEREHPDNQLRPLQCRLRHWELASYPPSSKQVKEWLRRETASDTAKQVSNISPAAQRRKDAMKLVSQVEGPTQNNKHGFKYSQKKASTAVKHETQYMSIMSLEVHVNSRDALAPDPAKDEIQSIFWCVQGEEGSSDDHSRIGILCLSDDDGIVNRIRKQSSVTVEAEEHELELINRIVDIVRYFNPDILTGYEVHNSSWGYLIERARLQFEYDLCDEISRTKSQSHGRFGKEADRWGFTHTSTIRVTGRHMINIWRAMRGELNLLQYTLENVVCHLLHKRIPHYHYIDLTTWYTSSKPRDLAKVLDYFTTRVQLNLEILEANEIVPRTSEQARLLGVDFFSVISRGSQYKVESAMFRIAKPENYILVSPSRKQVGQQNALECLPLVMEPQSSFYPSPLLVLDFQSLYPSVMIAYNYCYSTCLGRVVPWRGRNKLGFMDFDRQAGSLGLAKDHINIAPNGIMYVRPEMRKSLLAKMLGEILETRVMVKSGMKVDKDDKTLQQLLNNRQLALKLLANVTYGYTSASFSGRMPCSEIADSIVQTGRETLEKAIALIHSVKKWGAEVVYGDTDSLFIYLKGRTREQAFNIGEEIAEAVTQANPRPIKLKFEKVYHPCVLLAKKRYVGFKYESRHQKEPEFDAKGIETVRRDGTPAEQKIEEKALKILFRTSDLSQVKAYFRSQCTKIMEGRVSIQDFLFAKEVKLGTYSERGPPPPGALIATKRMLADPRAEPQYGERVPYVVITGAPNARLIDRCVSPETLLHNDHLELDAEYYITKNLIPPLERIFNLVGASVRQWYDEMPKVQRIRSITLPLHHQQPIDNTTIGEGIPNHSKTLEGYMKSSTCLVCRSKLPPLLSRHHETDAYVRVPVCKDCLRKPARALFGLKTIIWKNEKRLKQVDTICRNCSNLAWGEEIRCDSRDCPVFYTRNRQRAKLDGLKNGLLGVVEVLQEGETVSYDTDQDTAEEVDMADEVEVDEEVEAEEVGMDGDFEETVEHGDVREESSSNEMDW